MDDQEIEDLLDEYSDLLEQDFNDAIDEVETELQDIIDQNYPIDTDELPDNNNLDQIALERLETQLSSGFEANLDTLNEKSQSNIVNVLLLSNYQQILKNKTISLSIKNEITKLISDSKNSNANSKKQFFDTFGLTKKQQENITNYRKELNRIFASNNPETLSWKTLRQLSASQRVSAIYYAETGLKESQIDSLVKKQRTALLRSRAKAIGNTLSTKVYHEAQQLIIDTVISLNLVKPDQFKKFWVTKHDERVRHNHSATESLNSSGIDLDKPFNTPFGAVYSPPLEINCRCHVSIRKVKNAE